MTDTNVFQLPPERKFADPCCERGECQHDQKLSGPTLSFRTAFLIAGAPPISEKMC
jgi:hypothetical protein